MASNVDEHLADQDPADQDPIVPMMGAEGGFEPDEEIAPFRISGILCLLLGLLSITALIGYVMIAVPMAAFAIGLIALRKWDGPKPTGVTAAKIGMVLAVAFGTCGFFIHHGRSSTLGNQAEYFARQYLKIIGNGEFEIAQEMKKKAVNRLPLHMPLKEHYQSSEELIESMGEFRSSGMNMKVYALGPGIDWQIKRGVRVYQHYGRQLAEMVFTTPPGQPETEVYVSLEYEIDPDGDGQWRVDQFRADLKRIVAESVL